MLGILSWIISGVVAGLMCLGWIYFQKEAVNLEQFLSGGFLFIGFGYLSLFLMCIVVWGELWAAYVPKMNSITLFDWRDK